MRGAYRETARTILCEAITPSARPPTCRQTDWLCDVYLERYLEQFPRWCRLALDGSTVVGYLVGAPVPPLTEHGLAGQHQSSVFRDLWPRYPAHCHINLTAAARGRGIGTDLVRAFLAHCRAEHLAGAHVVTGAGARNVGFYLRCGLNDEVHRDALERKLCFLGTRF
ncbi:MAG: GNAT family N-acetyltransferase [Pseudomonadota bacterium]